MLWHGGNGEGGKDRWQAILGQVSQPLEFANEAGFLE